MLPEKEDIKTEFKQSFTDDVIVALVAFANAKGGSAYVGMCDNGSVCGIKLGNETLQKWLNEIKQKTEPQIIPDVEVVEVDGKTVVVLSIQEYPVKPVSFKGRYYVRQTNSNHLMTAFEISNAILKTKNSSWDFYTDPNHTINDIDLNKVQFCIDKMKRRGLTIEESPIGFLQKKEFINGNNITFGGYLLFKAREDIMTTVELGFFQDSDGIIIKDSARLKNCLVLQVDDVMDYVKKHINMAIEIVPYQTENVQRWDYPLDAIREIVLNMIVHRDYRSSADSIVKIFPNRIEFYNPGTLPDEISITDLLTNNYRSLPRNKQIADIFKEMGEIEKYGSGIRRVVKMFTDYGLPAPEWKQNSGGVVVTVWKSVQVSDQVSDYVSDQVSDQVNSAQSGDNQNGGQVSGQVGGQVSDQVSDYVGDQVSDQVKLLLHTMNGEMVLSEMMDLLGLKHHHYFRLNFLNPALKLGLISMTLPDTPKSPHQKYYLTEKGKYFINKYKK